jgi:hypothetical protein
MPAAIDILVWLFSIHVTDLYPVNRDTVRGKVSSDRMSAISDSVLQDELPSVALAANVMLAAATVEMPGRRQPEH